MKKFRNLFGSDLKCQAMKAELGLVTKSEQVEHSSKSYPFVVKLLRCGGGDVDTSLKRRSWEYNPQILTADFRKELGVPPGLLTPFTQKCDRDSEKQKIIDQCR